MAYRKHTEVSTGIEDSLLKTPNGVEGIYYSLKGNTATANQFFLTDSTNHFLRGALYFDATPNEDSLGIVNEFLKQDLKHLINSLKWKER
jgi:gliding motility-associated lipoprotein GldD